MIEHARQLTCTILVLTAVVGAQIRPRFEIGIVAGEPTGLTGKYWLDSYSAIDAAVAWSFVENRHVNLYADYLFHYVTFPLNAKDPIVQVPLSVGIGVGLLLDDSPVLGGRIPFGVQIFPAAAPLGLFVEIAPVVRILPETALSLDGGAGIRYSFGSR